MREFKTLKRFLLHPNGNVTTIDLSVCICLERRGLAGGVCGNCGNAIPNEKENQELRK